MNQFPEHRIQAMMKWPVRKLAESKLKYQQLAGKFATDNMELRRLLRELGDTRNRLHPAHGVTDDWRFIWLFKPGSLWIGLHWSKDYQRWCLNLVPCLTLCIVKPGGTLPTTGRTCK